MLKSELRANDYRTHARDAFARAEASPLSQVRSRLGAAGAAWLELAHFEDQRAAHARTLLARVAANAQAAAGADQLIVSA